MMIQASFAQAEFAAKKRTTRRERFLAEMERVVPWARLVAAIEPFYPKGERGRPPIGLERMLRSYFLQQWYGLSDEGLEDAIYDIQSMRLFAGIDLGTDPVPDATTEEAEGNRGGRWTGEPLLKFRHLLEEHGLTKTIFEEVNALLSERQLLMKEGTIVDATIIAAAPSTKNQAKERDPEPERSGDSRPPFLPSTSRQMHQTKKGHQDYFGMKAHIGADVESGLVHTLTTTAANVADITETHKLLHGGESWALGDAGYTGVAQREEIVALPPQVKFIVAAKRSKIKALPEGLSKELTQAVEKLKAQVRALVEHPFHVLKNLFGYRKARYRGLAKNQAQLHTLLALVNLVIAKRRLRGATCA